MMLRRMIAVVVPCLLLLACGQGGGGTAPSAEPVAAGPIEVDLVTLLENTADYVGSEVSVAGTVEHVCRHGGKRMFIMGDDPDNRLKITAGESISVFDRELEGSEVRVIGVVEEQKVDKAQIESSEEDLADDSGPAEAGKGGEEHERTMGQSGECEADTVSFYSLECRSFETLE